jgi:hypothetical protein
VTGWRWPTTFRRGLIISILRTRRPHASCSDEGFDEARGQVKEEAMSSTLTSTCPLCGLGYPNRALLELHIREDHPQHREAAGEPQHDDGSRTASKVTTKTTAPRLRGPRTRPVLEAARRGIRNLGKLSRQMARRMAAIFSKERPRRPLVAREMPADHDAHASPPEHTVVGDRDTTRS